MKTPLTIIILMVFKVVFGQVDNFNYMNEKEKNYKAASNIHQEVKGKYHEVPWDEMYLLRTKCLMNILE
jgi:hypothetical protein